MIKIEDKLKEYYSKYLEFDIVVKKYNEKLKDKESNFNSILKSLEDNKGVDDIINFYKDNILANSQLRMKFEYLMFLISFCFELGIEIPEEIKAFYDNNVKFRIKTVFAVEKEDLVPTDTELLEKARTDLNNHPAISMMNGYNNSSSN